MTTNVFEGDKMNSVEATYRFAGDFPSLNMGPDIRQRFSVPVRNTRGLQVFPIGIQTRVRYSFVVPIYNDGALALAFCQEFQSVFRRLLAREDLSGQVELIFVNDGSTNSSWSELAKLPALFPFVKLIALSRNFGQHIALSAGYEHAQGAYVGMLNVDMEDPPSEIPRLLYLLETDSYDIVTALRTNRQASLATQVSSKLFHQLLNVLTGSRTPVNCSTLRIMNRPFVDAYNRFSERERYIPGLEYWLGFRHGYVETQQAERKAGRSSYNFRKRIRFASRTVLSFSSLPLKIAVMAGFGISTLGFLLIAFLIVSKLFFTNYQPGYTSTLSLIVFFGGTQIAVIGVVGLYVGRILTEVQGRPLYVVRKKVGL